MLDIEEIQQLCLQNADADLGLRLRALCEYFLNTEYGAWQDGSNLESLDDFNYQLDKLDCVTFVEVVLSFAKIRPSSDLQKFSADFDKMLRNIHYKNGRTDFMSRNHFMCLDWIANNKFVVEDITRNIAADTATASALIDKLEWIKRHKILQDKSSQLSVLQDKLQPQMSEICYITTESFLENHDQFKDNFPAYSIVNIVRPNWDLTAQIGTHLNISHLGFAFNEPDDASIAFYHATSERKLVVRETLLDYMTRFKDSPTIRGFDVLAISPGFMSLAQLN